MATIEERAEAWARLYALEHDYGVVGFNEADLINAYLAGSAQTQQDYARG